MDFSFDLKVGSRAEFGFIDIGDNLPDAYVNRYSMLVIYMARTVMNISKL